MIPLLKKRGSLAHNKIQNNPKNPMSFASLKKQSSSIFSKLNEELEKQSTTTQTVGPDTRFWKPELDKSGNGYAVLRFLPAPEGEDLPWAKVWSHAFQGPGGWYIENSLTTLNKKDPVGELNRQLWNSGSDADKEVARKQKRKLSYYANVYVVQDPAHPENEGRVFLYKFGKKIFDKLMEAMQPAFADETPINPFDFWQGADFKLKIRKVEGYWNYDKSEFASPAVLGDFDDSELEKIWKQSYSLAEFTAPDNFKTFEELQARLTMVLSNSAPARVDLETFEDEEYDAKPASPALWGEEVNAFRQKVSAVPAVSSEDKLSYFASLAEED